MNEPYEVYREYPCEKPEECKKTAKHFIDVTVPVDIKPDAKVGKIEIECCGEPVVMCDDGKRPEKDSCRLLLVQKVSIKIPIRYTFRADAGEGKTDCCAVCGK